MNKNDIIEILTERMSFGEAAVGRHTPDNASEPIVIFVHGACANEKVRAKITHCHKRYYDAEVVEIIEPSKDRISPACSYFGYETGKCGGCEWQHISYDAQIKAKTEILIHQISKTTQQAIKLSDTDLRQMLQVHEAKMHFGYRNRIQMRGNSKKLGFFSRNTHEIVDIEKCLVANEKINHSLNKFRNSRKQRDLNNEYKIEFALDSDGNIQEAINRSHAAFGFTQINDEQNLKMRNIVKKAALKANPRRLLLDLYGGNGNLSNELKDHFTHTLCVDSDNRGLPMDALAMRETGRIMIREDTESFMLQSPWFKLLNDFNDPDCVIIDPPRSGLGKEINDLMKLNTQYLIYVSCDPSTLARDLSILLRKFKLDELHLVDMFPQTHHIESIVILKN